MSDKIINDQALDILFRTARTHNGWQERDVSRALMQAVYDLAKWGPTSANCSPARFVFVTSDEGKKRLKSSLLGSNVEKTLAASACVIIAHDTKFHEHLPTLFPHTDAKSWFDGDDDLIAQTAFRNGTLQGAYFMIAARALGLDCGPMSGFDKKGVDREFFKGTSFKSNFLCNIGYGTDQDLFERAPRFDFEEVCEVV